MSERAFGTRGIRYGAACLILGLPWALGHSPADDGRGGLLEPHLTYLLIAGTTAALGRGPGLLVYLGSTLIRAVAISLAGGRPEAVASLTATTLCGLGVWGAVAAGRARAIGGEGGGERGRWGESHGILGPEARRILDELFCFVGVLSPDGTMIECNRSPLSVTGLAREQVIGRLFWECPWWDHDEEMRRRVRRAIDRARQGNASRFDARVKTAGGGELAIDCLIAPVRGDGDEVLYIVPTAVDITDRARAEEVLRENLHFQESLLDAIPTPVFYKGRDGRYQGCNEAFQSFLGRSAAEIIGKTVSDISPPDLGETYSGRDRELLAGPGKQCYESRVIDSRGMAHEVTFHKASYGDDDGTVHGIVGVILDITDRKRAEEALARSEEWFRALVEHAHGGFTVLDPDATIRYVSPSVERVTGREVEYWTGREALHQIHEDDRDYAGTMLAEMLSRPGETVETRPIRLLHADGRQIWISFTGRNLIDLPAVGGIVLNWQEVTERVEAEEKLQENERNLRRILDNLAWHTVLLGLDGEIRWANRAATDFLGVTRGQILGSRLLDNPIGIDPFPDSLAGLEACFSRGVRGFPGRIDIVMRRADGAERILDFQLRPIHDEWGAVQFLVASAVDITERKQSEAALAEEAIRRRIFIEQSSDGIVVLDSDGGVYEANARFGELLGYTPDEVRELHVWDWDVRWTHEEVLRVVRSSDELGTCFETRHRRKDGTVLDVEISGNAATFGGRKLVFCVCRDVSQRKRAERALRESEERYRRVLENIPDVIAMYDGDLRVRYVNPAVRQITGRSPEEFLGKRDDESWPREVWEIYQPALRDALETRTIRSLEVDLTFAATGTHSLQITCVPITDDLGEVRDVVGIGRDLTERKAQEREIQRLNRLYATLSALNRSVIDIDTREELFREVCRITVEHAGFKVVWLGWHDLATGEVKPVAQAGDGKDYVDHLHIYSDDRPEGRGPAGISVRTGRPSICHDFVDEARAAPWREMALAHGLRSAAAVPIRFDGEIVGVFTVYAGEVGGFQDREVALLEEIAATIGFAMDHLAQEQKRRQAEERLAIREAQYRAVIETCTDGFWMTDNEGRLLEVNDAYVRCSGYGREELLGKRIADLEAKESPREAEDHIAEIRRARGDLFETEHRRKDGSVWPVEVNAAYWPSAGGRFFSFLRDITQRKSAERAIRQWADAFENCAHGIALHNPASNRILACNPAYARLQGYEPAEVVGAEVLSRYAAADRERVRQSIEQADREGRTRYEALLNHKEGSTVPVQVDMLCVRHEGTRLLYRVSTVQDITERRAAEEVSRERVELQGQLARIAASVPGAIYSFRADPDGQYRIPFATPAIEDIFGIPRPILAESMDVLFANVHPEDGRRVGEVTAEVVRDRTPWHDEFRYLHPEKGVRWVEGWAAPQEERQGSVIWHGFMTDITDRKQVDQAFRESQATLRAIVNTAVDAIITIDDQGTVLSFNAAAQRLFGYMPEEILGHNVSVLIPQPHRDEHDNYLSRYLDTGNRWVIGRRREIPASRKDGTVFPMEIGVSEVLEEGKRVYVGILRDITERKRAEEEIRGLNEHLRRLVAERTGEVEAMLSNASIGLAFLDHDLRFQRINGPLAEIGGRPVDAYAGLTLGEALPGMAPDFEPRFRRLLETGEAVSGIEIDAPLVVPSAERRSFLASFFPVAAAGGEVIYAGCAITEITPLRRAQDELTRLNRALQVEIAERRQAEQQARRLAHILEATPDFVAVAETSGRVTFMNRAFRETVGLTPDEALPLVGAHHTEWAERLVLEEGLPTAAREGRWVGETVVLAADGRHVPVSQLILCHRDPQGEIQHYSTVMRDLTERKRAEEELRVGEERLRLALEATGAGLYFMALPEKTVHWSSRLREIYQMAPDEPIDPMGFERLVHPDDRVRVAAAVARSLEPAGDGRLAMEHRVLQTDGELIWVEVLGRTNFEGQGSGRRPVRWAGIVVDITARKALEESLLLQSEQLSLANAELARSARLKDEFLASMSHELRTPLNSILGLSEALRERIYGPLSEEQVDALLEVEQSGRHLLGLINDVLDLSKVGAGKLGLEPAPTSIADVCQASMRMIKQAAHEKRLRVTSSVDGNLDVVLADPRRLKQILVNLLSNAVKFTPEGGSIGLEAAGDTAGQVVNFTVWDTGIGIEAKDLRALFQPFRQIDSSLSRRYPGTGLGLALVRKLAELHGGTAGVESEPGKGSRFSVSIPWRPAEGGDAGGPAVAPPEGVRSALVIEDSPSGASTIARYLGELGIKTTQHPFSTGARERARHARPDVILLDPGLLEDGWALLAALAVDPALGGVPVVVVGEPGQRGRGLSLGACDYVDKPILRDQLRRAIVDAVASHRREPGGAPPARGDDPAPEVAGAGLVASRRAVSPLILVVDDNEAGARVVSDYLEASGLRTERAGRATEAIRIARELGPRLIVMDIQMPELDGLEAIRRLRRDPVTAGIRIIALTALAMPGDLELCMEAGADCYLSRPVSLRQLHDMILALLPIAPGSVPAGP